MWDMMERLGKGRWNLGEQKQLPLGVWTQGPQGEWTEQIHSLLWMQNHLYNRCRGEGSTISCSGLKNLVKVIYGFYW